MHKVSVQRVLLIVLALLPFLPAVSGDFIWDDRILIRDNPNLGQWSDLLLYFQNDMFEVAGVDPADAFRPLGMASFLLEVVLHTPNPAFFHLTNLVLHGLNTVLVLYLGRRLLEGHPAQTWAPLAAGVFFAVHPLQADSVSWISARFDLLSALFGGLACLAAMGRPTLRRWAVVVALAMAAVLSKESMLALVGLLPLAFRCWWWVQTRGSSLDPPSCGGDGASGATRSGGSSSDAVPWPAPSLWSGLIAYGTAGGLAAAVLLGLKQRAGAATGASVVWEGGSRLLYDAALAMGAGWRLLLGPQGYNIFRLTPASAGGFEPVQLALPLCLALAGLLLWRRHPFGPPAVGALLWFFLSFAIPALASIHLSLLPDRYGYFPLMGVALGLGVALEGERRRLETVLAPALVNRFAMAVLIGFFLMQLIILRARSGVWQDEPTLYAQDLARDDANYYAHFQMAQLRGRENDWARAAQHYAQAVMLNPTHATSLTNLAGALLNLGQLEASVQIGQRARAVAGDNPRVHFNLGVAYEQLGDRAAAKASYSEAVRLAPGYVRAREALKRLVARGE